MAIREPPSAGQARRSHCGGVQTRFSTTTTNIQPTPTIRTSPGTYMARCRVLFAQSPGTPALRRSTSASEPSPSSPTDYSAHHHRCAVTPVRERGPMEQPTPEEIEQLVRSISISPSLGERDRIRAIEWLRILASLLRSRRPQPARATPSPARYRGDDGDGEHQRRVL